MHGLRTAFAFDPEYFQVKEFFWCQRRLTFGKIDAFPLLALQSTQDSIADLYLHVFAMHRSQSTFATDSEYLRAEQFSWCQRRLTLGKIDTFPSLALQGTLENIANLYLHVLQCTD